MGRGKCEKWLGDLLADGELHLCDVREAARKEGFSKGELRAARRASEWAHIISLMNADKQRSGSGIAGGRA